MKKTTQLFTALICFALWQASVQAATNYWDSNGITAGAGTAPTGTWDADAFWSPVAGGTAATAAWASGDTAVFSAGTDATDLFTVTVNGDVQPAGITFEEGAPTISGGSITMNAADFPIIAHTNATISSALEGSGFGFKKTGTGTLTLSGSSFHDGTNTVGEGVVAITSASALGSTLAPTIVSNGAALQVSTASGMSEPVILNGSGIANGGALRGHTANATWTGGATLGSDARINSVGGAWTWTTKVISTNGLNNADVYFGGTGTTIRLNINTLPNETRRPCIDIGDGVIYKDGTTELRLENSNVAREVRFNEGHILARCGPGTNFCYRAVVPGVFVCNEGVSWTGDYVPATIYVGPNAGQFRNGTGGPSQEWEHPIVLAAGANPVFRPQSFTDAYMICNGLISGLGGLSKFNDVGILYLKTNNTYSGNTIILGGTLALGANGSISNSAAIDLQSNAALTNTATFDVSGVTGGFVLQPAQTLKGNGTVLGNVTAKGAISPGASVGALTFNNNLTLGGSLLIDVDKSLSSSNDVITVTGTLSHSGGGAVTVANLGPALAPGDSFQIFSQAVANGQTMTVAGGGATWINNLAVDGSITVLAAAPPAVPATNLIIAAVGPASFSLGGSGAANSAYKVYASTNVTTPMTNWWLIGTTNSSAGGVIQFLDPQATNAQRFYRFGQPSP